MIFHPSVSVIIKTYDDSATSERRKLPATLKKFLEMTLQVLEEQTLRPHEILVIDSSAGDGIAQVVRNHSLVNEIPINVSERAI
jgi:glycosyltransferase involved in cell wall biosynthesis